MESHHRDILSCLQAANSLAVRCLPLQWDTTPASLPDHPDHIAPVQKEGCCSRQCEMPYRNQDKPLPHIPSPQISADHRPSLLSEKKSVPVKHILKTQGHLEHCTMTQTTAYPSPSIYFACFKIRLSDYVGLMTVVPISTCGFSRASPAKTCSCTHSWGRVADNGEL